MSTAASCKEEELLVDEPLSEEELEYLQWVEKTAENGFFLDGKKMYANIQNERYSSLQEQGNFVNDLDNYVLLLRNSENEIIANNNCCPHLGTINQWTFDGSKYRCGNHGNTFGINGLSNDAGCSARRTSGNLKQYTAVLQKDIVIVDFDS